MEDVIIKSERIDQISVLTISGESETPQPLVFFVHGVASDKRQGIRLGHDLAKLGIFYVSLDTVLRGDRADAKFDPDIGEFVRDTYPPETGLDDFLNMIMMIRQTVKDLRYLIKYYSHDPRIDSQRIGIVGYSMGGLISYCAAGYIPEIAATTVIASLPKVEQLWRDILMECSANPEWTAAMTRLEAESEKWATYIREMDPSTQLLNYPEKPLLLISGGDDPLVPKVHAIEIFRTLKPLYKKNPDNIHLSVYEGINHQFYPLMMDEITDWFGNLWSLE